MMLHPVDKRDAQEPTGGRRSKIVMVAAILIVALGFLVSPDFLVRSKLGGFAPGGTAEPVSLVPIGE